MTTTRLAELVELLPEDEQIIILQLVIKLLPDDVATDEDLKDIAQARAEYARGECVTLEDITKSA